MPLSTFGVLYRDVSWFGGDCDNVPGVYETGEEAENWPTISKIQVMLSRVHA